MSSAVGQIFGFVASGFIAERLGRRFAIATMISIGALCVGGVVASADTELLALGFSFLSGFFLVGASGIRGTLLTENLPRNLRASGVGFLYDFGVIGGGVAPFILLSSMRRRGISLAIAITALTIGATRLGALLSLVRETKSVDLTDVD